MLAHLERAFSIDVRRWLQVRRTVRGICMNEPNQSAQR
jgi:hypothetical protein